MRHVIMTPVNYAEWRAKRLEYYQNGGQRNYPSRQQRRARERYEEEMTAKPLSDRVIDHMRRGLGAPVWGYLNDKHRAAIARLLKRPAPERASPLV